VTPGAALRTARKAGTTGQFYVTAHALQRQDERSVTQADIASALASSMRATYQPQRRTWRLGGGRDLDGEELTVVVVFEQGVVVVTVF
jgi:hypothetical protein